MIKQEESKIIFNLLITMLPLPILRVGRLNFATLAQGVSARASSNGVLGELMELGVTKKLTEILLIANCIK